MLRLMLFALTIPLGLDFYMPAPEDNPPTVERIARGRQLFHDRRLSRDMTVSCASCHDPERAFSDGRPVAIGIGRQLGHRNAPAILNRGWGRAFFWDGRADTLEVQVLLPIQDPREMDLTLGEATARTGLSSQAIAQALASYVRSIMSGNAPYDRFLDGDRAALSPIQQAGLQVFRGRARCTRCHVGPNLTDEQFHNTGVAWANGAPLDEGRAAVTRLAADRGAFKTPTLREIARTGPYMHDGSMLTLDEVIAYYDRGGNANAGLDPALEMLQLTTAEKESLAAFLQALTGTVIEGDR